MRDKIKATEETEEEEMVKQANGIGANECVRAILTHDGLTQTELANRLGMRPLSLIQRLRNDNVSVEKLLEMLDALGYDLIIAPTGDEIREGEYRIGTKQR